MRPRCVGPLRRSGVELRIEFRELPEGAAVPSGYDLLTPDAECTKYQDEAANFLARCLQRDAEGGVRLSCVVAVLLSSYLLLVWLQHFSRKMFERVKYLLFVRHRAAVES